MPLKQLLTPLPFTQVQLHDAFWAPRMLANRSATLPAEYAQLESTGRLAALELAWQPGAGNPNMFESAEFAASSAGRTSGVATVPDEEESGEG